MPDNEANLAVHGGVVPPRGPQTLGLWNSVFCVDVWCLGWCPERGLLPSDEPVGRYPTIHHYPEDETINPATDGATPKTPAVKNPPP